MLTNISAKSHQLSHARYDEGWKTDDWPNASVRQTHEPGSRRH